MVLRWLTCILLLLPMQAVYAADDFRIRPAVKAGSWYPETPGELAELIDTMLDDVQARGIHPPKRKIRALVVPYTFRFAYASRITSLSREGAYTAVNPLDPI